MKTRVLVPPCLLRALPPELFQSASIFTPLAFRTKLLLWPLLDPCVILALRPIWHFLSLEGEAKLNGNRLTGRPSPRCTAGRRFLLVSKRQFYFKTGSWPIDFLPDYSCLPRCGLQSRLTSPQRLNASNRGIFPAVCWGHYVPLLDCYLVHGRCGGTHPPVTTKGAPMNSRPHYPTPLSRLLEQPPLHLLPTSFLPPITSHL